MKRRIAFAMTSLDRADDRECNLILQGKNILDGAIIALGPDVHAVRGIDELLRDPSRCSWP
jgi:hypothetical protein